MNKIWIAFLTSFGLLSASCSEKTNTKKDDGNGLDRTSFLTFYADSIIRPSYQNFNSDFQLMRQSAELFIANPNETNLTNFRNNWASAYLSWQSVELFDFGPAEKITLRNFYNIYPADTNGIHANILNPSNTLETPVSYAQQGFPALDYLLNGVGSNQTEILNFYTNADQGSKRTAYIKRLIDKMDLLLSEVITDWNGNYKNTFISQTGLDIGSSTSLMVNGLVLHYERFIRTGKFGIPSGVVSNGILAPNKVEAFYKKDISKSLAQASHLAYINYFNGKSFGSNQEGSSLKTYLDALNAKDNVSGKNLSTLINEQFAIVEAKLNLLNPNLSEEVTNNNSKMIDVATEMQAVVRMLKVDMSSAMSITITYTDNDGD
ncbi:MAG: imelysin family protein [Bacteroidia bacterium]|nr:imelysin family protein [Bacteroidia bacterium]MCF8426487.1 imelysin family protein [Bacteroidia bacterium]